MERSSISHVGVAADVTSIKEFVARSTYLLIAMMTVLFGGCAAGFGPPSGIAGAPAGPAAVERFLQLAGEREYQAMGWIFGTSEGPILELYPVPEVEQRMYALASLLAHDSFAVGSGSPVPGRMAGALSFSVRLQRGSGAIDVPFTAVRGPQERWFVEQIAVEAITAR